MNTEKKDLNKKKSISASLKKKLNIRIKEILKELKNELQLKSAKLSKYSTSDILKQGYTITRKNGKVITRGIELKKSDIIETQFSDMKVKSSIK